ncbi:drug/metabolite transporter (DMT)-like permease [Arthrobacter russicus]|uniref:Drug/metabolite transporter (DMT)-like permease n=1 Tax=Arthrobacter russicus TaxID=172040 RepID=A0ABU1JAI8_9MICC|nr:drug/metabolite transporter (DMT)-like permease [Arthrobacter russicus]
MNLLALGLVLAAAVAHAVWNLAAKKAGAGGVPFVWLASVCSAVLLAPLGIWGVLGSGGHWLPWLLGGAVSGVLHTGYFVLLQRGYAQGDISVVYPLARGTGPALSVLLALLVLGERPGWPAVLGAAVVVGGVVLIGLSGSTPTPAKRPSRLGAGVLYGVLTGFTIAAYTLWDAHSVTSAGLAVFPISLMWGSALAEVLLLAPFALRSGGTTGSRVRSVWSQNRREVLIVATVSPLAYVLVLFALQLAPVAMVAPARELSVVFVTLAGAFLLHEAEPRKRLIGAGIVVAGVALIAVS